MLRKSLRQCFSFKNTFSTSSFFEILNPGTKKICEDQLIRMSHNHLLGDVCFFVKKVKLTHSKGKIKPISKLMASCVMFWERKKVQGIYIFDITDFFMFFTHCNVHDLECNIHDTSVLSSSKHGTHHKRNIYHFVIVVSLFT